jgi:hypothetical protein
LFRRLFPKQLSDPELWNKLQRDVEEVQKHITEVFRYRKLFADTSAMLQEHPTLRTSDDAGYWYEWLRTIYAHYITMSVRRELDRHADAPNLYRLLRDISKRPEVLSRARYRQHFTDSSLSTELANGLAETSFTEVAGPGEYIDRKIVKRDLKNLNKQAQLVIKYADKIVAHRTPQSVPTTLRHVNTSLEAIENILKKYYLILTGRSLIAAEPSILTPWQRAFRQPWIV